MAQKTRYNILGIPLGFFRAERIVVSVPESLRLRLIEKSYLPKKANVMQYIDKEWTDKSYLPKEIDTAKYFGFSLTGKPYVTIEDSSKKYLTLILTTK